MNSERFDLRQLPDPAPSPPPEPVGSSERSEAATPRPTIERDSLFDAMRGFGIILVVMGHAMQGGLQQADENFAFRMIYSFHMPLFFFISGYILQISLQGKPLEPLAFVVKKTRTLALPYLSWYLIFGLWRGIPSDITLSQYLHRTIREPDYGYWFLWTLFLCFLVILPVAWLQQRIPPRWRPGLLGLAGLTLYLLRCTELSTYGIHLLKDQYFYFAAGFFICYWRKQLAMFGKWWPEVCIVGFLLLIPYWRRVGEMPFQPFLKTHFPRKEFPLTDVFRYVLALFGIGTVAQVVKSLMAGAVGRWLSWIGGYTLDIYVIHFWTFALVPFGLIFRSARGDVFMILMNVAWGLCASLVISLFVIRQSSILKFLFLGILDVRKRVPIKAVS